MRLIVATLLAGSAAAGHAAETQPKLDCTKFEHLADGSWKGKAGAVVLLRGSRIDFSGTHFRDGQSLIDGVDMVIMLNEQCATPKWPRNSGRR